MSDRATVLMARIDELAKFSEEPHRLVRRSLTPALQQANDLVASWMLAAGMTVRQDAVGNLVGTYAGVAGASKTLILGSHLDSVRDAGKYDGPLGVLAALACVERLHEEGQRLPFAVEVISFVDEEGLRFRTSYLGSSALAGSFNPSWLDYQDEQGVVLADALRRFGGDPADIASCRRNSDDLLGYCEVHIEQGPVLEAEDLPVGVVDGIAGQDRLTVEFTGVAGHAGTVPMARRHDALCAAAELVLAVERTGQATDGLVATMGQIAAEPGASNVIPGHVTLSLDVRHRDDAVRTRAVAALHDEATAIAQRRGVHLVWTSMQSTPAVPCSPQLIGRLAHAIEELGFKVQHLTSGAGHDAVPMASLTDAAMLFVRCKGGISHNPAESVRLDDVNVSLETLYRFVLGMQRDMAL
ncbi:MAG: allantoate amidohydrolase [Chloroflexi bacterium]|nr:allantoate amidohydrolase [Chloroflexota bacterium]